MFYFYLQRNVYLCRLFFSMIFDIKIVIFRSLYLFALFALIGYGSVLAQETPVVDSLELASPDAIAVDFPVDSALDSIASSIFSGDSVAMDSIGVATRKESAFNTRIKYQATDSVVFDRRTNRTYLYMDTQVNYEDMELQAYKTEFDMTTKIVYAIGGVDSLNVYFGAPVYKQGSETFNADSMSYNFDSGQSIINNIRTQQGEGYLHATRAKRFPEGHIFMGGGKYTTCDSECCPHFYLALRQAKVIPGDLVAFRHAYLVLLDVPLYLLYLPFGWFPQTNKEAVSGVIPPTIGMEISRGLSLTNGGYYFAFNDHIDAQVMGDIYSTGTWRSTLTSRYIKRYKFSGNLNMSYGVTVTGEKGLDQAKTKQYSAQWTHRQDPKANPYNSFQATVNYSSSSYDREFNYTNSTAYFNNTKNSSISFSRRWPNTPFHLSTNMRANQVSTTGITTIDFPNFNFRMDRIYPFRKKESVGKARWYEDIALQYDASLQNTLTGHEDDLFNEKNLKEMRNGFQHRIPFSINFKALRFFNITPSVNYTGVMYSSQIRKRFERDSIDSRKGTIEIDTIRGLSYAHALSPSLSVSMTPKFFLMNTYGPNSKVEAIRTVISPTVGVSYVPDLSRFFDYYETITAQNDNPHRYSIYEGRGPYGTPSAPGQSGSVNMGINGNVEMKVRSDDSTAQSRKVKLINNISATTRYDMFADSMNFSNISLSANTTVLGMNLALSGSVDPYALTPEGIRINKYGPRLVNMSFNTGLSLPLNRKEGKTAEEGDPYAYFNVPWNVNFNYGISYSKPRFEGQLTQTLSFSGNVNFTPKWSLNFSSSYDFEAKQIAYTSASINRDLCCWQMSISFSPFGANRFYFFTINVKSQTLQDMKYERRMSARDFSRHGW